MGAAKVNKHKGRGVGHSWLVLKVAARHLVGTFSFASQWPTNLRVLALHLLIITYTLCAWSLPPRLELDYTILDCALMELKGSLIFARRSE